MLRNSQILFYVPTRLIHEDMTVFLSIILEKKVVKTGGGNEMTRYATFVLKRPLGFRYGRLFWQ